MIHLLNSNDGRFNPSFEIHYEGPVQGDKFEDKLAKFEDKLAKFSKNWEGGNRPSWPLCYASLAEKCVLFRTEDHNRYVQRKIQESYQD